MDDAIHSAAGTLDRLLERVHCASDVFFEGVSYQDVILLGITVIGTRSGEIIDPVERMVIAAGPTGSIFAGRVRGCATNVRCGSGSLLGKEFRHAGYKCRRHRDLAKEISPSVDSHRISPSSCSVDESPDKLSPSERLPYPAAR